MIHTDGKRTCANAAPVKLLHLAECEEVVEAPSRFDLQTGESRRMHTGEWRCAPGCPVTDTAESVQADAERPTWQEIAEAADPACPDQRFRYLLASWRKHDSPAQRAYFNDLPDALRARDYVREHGSAARVVDRQADFRTVTWGDVCGCSWTEDKCPFRAGNVAGCSAAQGVRVEP